jgi:stearoyl-CoA desaturase (delta-9 desaturase)
MNTQYERPWMRPWYSAHPDGQSAFYWLIFLHVSAIAGLVFLPLPSLNVILGTAALAFTGALGTTIAYHRCLTHRGIQLNSYVEQFLILLAVGNGSATPRTWVANHRQHHATADTPEDISSPYYGGFWWSHIRWLWQCPQTSFSRYCPELNQPRYTRWETAMPYVLAFSVLGGFLISPTAALWLGPIRLLWSLHGQCSVNSICHLDELDSPPKGSSKNIWWLTPLFLGIGENWHANHHTDQRNPRLGLTRPQIDMGWYAIKGLMALGLAVNLRERSAALKSSRQSQASLERQSASSNKPSRRFGLVYRPRFRQPTSPQPESRSASDA